MAYFIIKTLITAIIIATISEISRRNSVLAALLASIPLTSVLAFIWIYYDTKDTKQIIELSYSIIWLIIPSISFFIALPLLLKKEMAFIYALPLSLVIMFAFYGIFILAKEKMGF